MQVRKHVSAAATIIARVVGMMVVAILLVAVVIGGVFAFQIVSEGIDSKLIALDAIPQEEIDQWRVQYRNEALRGWAIPAIIGIVFCTMLIRAMIALIRGSWRRRPQTQPNKTRHGNPGHG